MKDSGTTGILEFGGEFRCLMHVESEGYVLVSNLVSLLRSRSLFAQIFPS